MLGFWLFGRRDPDDIYSQLEIPILKSLANQTAIALSNILQTERLKAMYQADATRYEHEKQQLAHDLHDSILNQMAVLMMKLDLPSVPPAFQHAYDELVQRLREIVSDLRPPVLNFGFKIALEDLAESLSERNPDAVKIVSDIQADGEVRYPETVENHLYRIAQEAMENALRYAHAKTIRFLGGLSRDRIELRVEDDGIGFNAGTSLKPDHMLANKHFGLAGMLERADLIGAEIRIDSKPNQGTKIQIRWESKRSI